MRRSIRTEWLFVAASFVTAAAVTTADTGRCSVVDSFDPVSATLSGAQLANMAEPSNPFARFFGTKDAKLKDAYGNAASSDAFVLEQAKKPARQGRCRAGRGIAPRRRRVHGSAVSL